jgi:CRP/FNR family cyclic AMP-dependent transcriptional regulator
VSIFPTRFPDVPHDGSALPCQGQLKQLVSCQTVRVLPPQQVIFSQGELPQTVCLICNGLVKLTRTEFDGRRAIIGLRKKGWLLGVAALLPGLPYASTAETVTRSKLCFVPGDQFKREMKTNAPFSKWVSLMMSRGVYASVISISEKCALSGRQRLEKFLREMILVKNNCNTGKETKIPIPLKQWEMAQMLALTPEHLSRLIRKMEEEGILERKKGWLILLNPKGLNSSRKGANNNIQ